MPIHPQLDDRDEVGELAFEEVEQAVNAFIGSGAEFN